MEEIMEQIRLVSSSVTEDTYNTDLNRGYELLMKLHEMGVDKESVYRPLLEYHNGLEDGIAYDYVADILDYVSGWCSPKRSIW